MSDAAIHGQDGPHGADLLPRDLTDEDFAAAPVLTSLDDLLIEDLTDDEYDSFIDALFFVKVVVDTGVFSAALSHRRRPRFEPYVGRLVGHQLNLAVQTVAELRFGALKAGWAETRRSRLESTIATATVIPVTDPLLTAVAEFRLACKEIGHPLAADAHHEDLWIAATAVHIRAPLVTADGVFSDVPGLTLL